MTDTSPPPSLHGRATQPPQAPPPFPPPTLASARRIPGMVLTAPDTTDSMAAPSLERQASVTGNILLIEGTDGQQAYLLQRKIKSTLFGTVRIGYRLKGETEEGLWEVAKRTDLSLNDNGKGEDPQVYDMVEITIEDKTQVLHDNGAANNSNTAQDPQTELSALQLVAASREYQSGHVLGTAIIATDQSNIYTITNYHKDGTLLEYCQGAPGGQLCESDARYFFCQILEGLKTLQHVQLCHRDLSLESVRLNGTYCSLTGLTCALRIPTETSPDGGATFIHLIEPQPPCGSYTQYVAPELLTNQPFDGYAVDLWSAGVMLFCMLFGSEALFVAPVNEDRKFKEICHEGNLRLVVARERSKKAQNQVKDSKETAGSGVSDAALDLLQGMLRADPKDRLTLWAVLEHPWVLAAATDKNPPPKVPREPQSVI